MTRLFATLATALLILSACGHEEQVALLQDGKPPPTIWHIGPTEQGKIPFRVLDSVNALRSAKGLQKVELSGALNSAAATHSKDMSVQNRPWHFGSDGSSPIERVQRTGFTGRMTGENISESYEGDVETVAAWMDAPDTRAIILDPTARFMGIAWFQEVNGKIWWTQVFGG